MASFTRCQQPVPPTCVVAVLCVTLRLNDCYIDWVILWLTEEFSQETVTGWNTGPAQQGPQKIPAVVLFIFYALIKEQLMVSPPSDSPAWGPVINSIFASCNLNTNISFLFLFRLPSANQLKSLVIVSSVTSKCQDSTWQQTVATLTRLVIVSSVTSKCQDSCGCGCGYHTISSSLFTCRPVSHHIILFIGNTFIQRVNTVERKNEMSPSYSFSMSQ